MALLKSAWEIALERTGDITADPKKIHDETVLSNGRKLAASLLFADNGTDVDVDTPIAQAPQEDKELLRRGIAMTILANIALIQTEDQLSRYDAMIRLARIASDNDEQASALIGQIRQFLTKYLAARNSLVDRMKQQYQGMWEDKQERLAQKYGKGIDIPMEKDPEFLQMLQKGYMQLSNQYQTVLDNAKEQLKELWDMDQA